MKKAILIFFVLPLIILFGEYTLARNYVATLAGSAVQIRVLPDLAITPGSLNLFITQSNIKKTICVPGFTAIPGYRPASSYTTALKIKQIEQYAYQDKKTADYEEDHLISLELGGNPTDPRNLWPQPYNTPLGARQKDQVENYLHTQVCASKMSLREAQQAITADWTVIYKTLKPSFGATLVPDPDDE